MLKRIVLILLILSLSRLWGADWGNELDVDALDIEEKIEGLLSYKDHILEAGVTLEKVYGDNFFYEPRILMVRRDRGCRPETGLYKVLGRYQPGEGEVLVDLQSEFKLEQTRIQSRQGQLASDNNSDIVMPNIVMDDPVFLTALMAKINKKSINKKRKFLNLNDKRYIHYRKITRKRLGDIKNKTPGKKMVKSKVKEVGDNELNSGYLGKKWKVYSVSDHQPLTVFLRVKRKPGQVLKSSVFNSTDKISISVVLDLNKLYPDSFRSNNCYEIGVLADLDEEVKLSSLVNTNINDPDKKITDFLKGIECEIGKGNGILEVPDRNKLELMVNNEQVILQKLGGGDFTVAFQKKQEVETSDGIPWDRLVLRRKDCSHSCPQYPDNTMLNYMNSQLMLCQTVSNKIGYRLGITYEPTMLIPVSNENSQVLYTVQKKVPLSEKLDNIVRWASGEKNGLLGGRGWIPVYTDSTCQKVARFIEYKEAADLGLNALFDALVSICKYNKDSKLQYTIDPSIPNFRVRFIDSGGGVAVRVSTFDYSPMFIMIDGKPLYLEPDIAKLSGLSQQVGDLFNQQLEKHLELKKLFPFVCKSMLGQDSGGNAFLYVLESARKYIREFYFSGDVCFRGQTDEILKEIEVDKLLLEKVGSRVMVSALRLMQNTFLMSDQNSGLKFFNPMTSDQERFLKEFPPQGIKNLLKNGGVVAILGAVTALAKKNRTQCLDEPHESRPVSCSEGEIKVMLKKLSYLSEHLGGRNPKVKEYFEELAKVIDKLKEEKYKVFFDPIPDCDLGDGFEENPFYCSERLKPISEEMQSWFSEVLSLYNLNWKTFVSFLYRYVDPDICDVQLSADELLPNAKGYSIDELMALFVYSVNRFPADFSTIFLSTWLKQPLFLLVGAMPVMIVYSSDRDTKMFRVDHKVDEVKRTIHQVWEQVDFNRFMKLDSVYGERVLLCYESSDSIPLIWRAGIINENKQGTAPVIDRVKTFEKLQYEHLFPFDNRPRAY